MEKLAMGYKTGTFFSFFLKIGQPSPPPFLFFRNLRLTCRERMRPLAIRDGRSEKFEERAQNMMTPLAGFEATCEDPAQASDS